MAERKTGPVKPPTIDLTARSASADQPKQPEAEKKPAPEKAKPETATAKPSAAAPGAAEKPADAKAASKDNPAKDAKSAPDAAPKRPRVLVAALLGAVAGGVLGLGGAYGLAYFGYWPGGNDTAAIATLSDEVKSLYLKKSDASGLIDRSVGETNSEIATLKDRVAALESATPNDPTAELTALQNRVGTLETGLGDLGKKLDAAVIGGGDQAAMQAVTDLGTRLDTLSTAVSALQDKPGVSPDAVTALQDGLKSVKDEVTTLSGAVTALQAVPAPKPVDLRLPLALDGLSRALETGKGFAPDLALIHAALPDLAIPADLTAAADTGLGTPAALQARFATLVPDILAAKPANPRAGWTDQLLDRLKALVALRPVAANGGNTPEALVSGIEAALSAHDYTTAKEALAALPAPMRAAAKGMDQSVGRFAALTTLIDQARAKALELAGTPS